MQLIDGEINRVYLVKTLSLSASLRRRLEALGMTGDAPIEIIHKKRNGTMVIVLRGTRFAIGRGIANRLTVEEVKE